MFNYHDFGDAIRLYTATPFSDATSDATPLDPDVVKLTVKQPDGTLTTFTYGDDSSEIVKQEVGSYYVDIEASQSGEWYYRWWSTGNGQAAEEKRFLVRPARAVET